MRKTETYLLTALLGSIALAGAMSCSGEDSVAEVPERATDSVRVRRLTITQSDATAAAQQLPTRATLVDADGLTASWSAGDVLTYCNLSRPVPGTGGQPYSGPLTALSTSVTSQFTGDVKCSKGDYLAVVYPAATFETNESYAISLAGQDGTLATLAGSYHYVFGKAQVTAVTDQTADATIGLMKSLLTVCKFSFVDKASGDAIAIRSLSISYGGSSSDEGTYPQTATVAIGVNTAQADVHATGEQGTGPLAVTCPSAQETVYVALLPTAARRTFRFTVIDGSGNTYSGSAAAALTEGEYIEATGLQLTEQ